MSWIRMCAMAIVMTCGVNVQANLLVNPGFETTLGSSDWGTTWGSFLCEKWNTPPSGVFAAYVRGAWSGSDNGGAVQSIDASAGKEYVLTAMVYIDNGFTSTDRSLKLEFFDAGGGILRAYTDDLNELADGKWVEKRVRGIAPEGTVRAQVVFEASGTGQEGVLGIDDVTLDQASAKQP